MRARYDFYADMLETHAEIGYLLVIAIALLLFDAAIALVVWRWPADDVYLVPGVEVGGTTTVDWGSPPPSTTPAEAGGSVQEPPTAVLPVSADAAAPRLAPAPAAAPGPASGPAGEETDGPWTPASAAVPARASGASGAPLPASLATDRAL